MTRLSRRLRLIVVTPGRGDLPELEQLGWACIKAGVSAIWVRERTLESAALADLFAGLRARAESRRTLLLLGGHSDWPTGRAPDGYQLGFRDAPAPLLRERIGSDTVLGYSAHDPLEPDRFSACDYVTLSPVYPTTPKPVERPPLGLLRFAELAARIEVPVIGLGGIDRHNAADVIRAGAAGVAVMRAVTDAADPERAARDLLSIVAEALG